MEESTQHAMFVLCIALNELVLFGLIVRLRSEIKKLEKKCNLIERKNDLIESKITVFKLLRILFPGNKGSNV